MALVVSGLLNKQVGSKLGISEITVKAHRGNVMRKMKTDSFVHLLNMASRLRVRYLPQVSLRSTNALLDSDRRIPPRDAPHGVIIRSTRLPKGPDVALSSFLPS
jgi:hypothetical protein